MYSCQTVGKSACSSDNSASVKKTFPYRPQMRVLSLTPLKLFFKLLLLVLLGANFLAVWLFHIDAIGHLVPTSPPLNQPSQFQFIQSVLDCGGAFVHHISQLVERKDYENISVPVCPAVGTGEVRPVQQNGIQQLGSLRQVGPQQETGIGQIGERLGVRCHVVSNRVHLPFVGR